MNPYDEVPYPSAPKSGTHPDRLAALATLLGMTPAPVDHCRVLEIGCSDGGNLVPMAQILPESEFVGFDLSPRQIASGESLVKALGLKNVHLQVASIMDVGPELGQFDYIICYGVYSWVPPEVQDRALQLTKQLLAPNGVAIISYNTFPGWHQHLAIREMMLYHTRRSDDLSQNAKQSREFLKFLIKATEAIAGRSALAMDTAAYTIVLKNEEAVLENRPDLYLVHEHLENDNHPVYFHEFAERTAGHGLQYVAEANFFTMHLSNFPSFASDEIKRLGLDMIESEQYMDFLRNRSFRQTLLCHDNIVLDRSLPAERLQSLYVASPMVPVSKENFKLKSDAPEEFVAPNDVVVTVSTPLAKAVMLYLSETWPVWTPFKDLLVHGHYRLDPNWLPVQGAEQARDDTQALGDMLARFYVADIVELHSMPTPYVGKISDRPIGSPVARYLADHGNHVVNLRHETITLDNEVSHEVLRRLDGTHDRAALLAMLRGLVDEGALVVHANGKSPGEAAESQSGDVLSQALDRALELLARVALLAG